MTDDLPLAVAPAPAPLPVLYPTLRDAWPRARPFTLNGLLERHSFHPMLLALLALVLAFVLTNLIGGIIFAVAAIAQGAGDPENADPMALIEAVMSDAGTLLSANAVGQWLGFALLAVLFARWSTRQWKPFLRLRAPDGPGLALAVLGWIVLFPGLQWLVSINQLIPQPEALEELSRQMSEMLEAALLGSDLSVVFLLLTVAVTPAVCEELLFRGYLQRQVERRFGLAWSLVGVGLVFGLYHMRLTELLPLAVLGTYLGFVVWATGSLWTGVLVHFLNNGLSVVAAVYVREHPTLEPEVIESVPVPWYLGLLSLAATAAVVALLRRRREAVAGTRPDAAPAEAEDPLAAPVLPAAP